MIAGHHRHPLYAGLGPACPCLRCQGACVGWLTAWLPVLAQGAGVPRAELLDWHPVRLLQQIHAGAPTPKETTHAG